MCRKWTSKEIKFLRDNAAKMSTIEIAARLDRSRGSVSSKRCGLGLKQYEKPKKMPLTESECLFGRTKNICTWWLTGDSVDEIRRLYKISENDVLAALRHNNGKTLKRRIAEIDGRAYRIKRTAKEISAMITHERVG